MLARILIAAAAAAAAVWLALGLHSARLLGEAREIVMSPIPELPPAVVERGDDLFRRGRRHNPDVQPVLDHAGLFARARRHRRAVAIAREAVRREPENAEAWALLAIVSEPTDRRLSAAATARARELNPPVRPAR